MVQLFHDEPVQQLKFKSSIASSPQQELCILYTKVIILVEAIGLFNCLRAYRNHLAKGKATK